MVQGRDAARVPPLTLFQRGAVFFWMRRVGFLSPVLLVLLVLLAVLAPLRGAGGLLRAQGKDSVAVIPPPDSARARRQAAAIIPPPISAGNAFLYSFAIPGLGQAKLDRPVQAAAFFLLEVSALALANRTAADVRAARQMQGDSVPLTYKTDPTTGAVVLGSTGLPEVASWQVSHYPAELVKARRLQYEDWMAIIIFNHLFSGADAFVAAQLWDLPQRVKLRAFPMPRGGAGVGLNVTFR
jgi:hypothetical protein